VPDGVGIARFIGTDKHRSAFRGSETIAGTGGRTNS
jgi:hypothetical protein